MKKSNIEVGVQATTWEEAIKAAGNLLVKAGSCTWEYVEGMVESVKKMGPYIVLTPHVALAHTRPSEAVKQSDISLAVLDEPVVFGHEDNDPVKLVFAFCATDNESHLGLLEKLSEWLCPEKVNELYAAECSAEVLAMIG